MAEANPELRCGFWLLGLGAWDRRLAPTSPVGLREEVVGVEAASRAGVGFPGRGRFPGVTELPKHSFLGSRQRELMIQMKRSKVLIAFS